MTKSTKKIAVIDGNSWTHRAYHAVPPVMKLADGTPTNAVHGFMNMFMSFYDKAQPDAVICAFDAGIPQFRLEAVEQYKAQRKPMDNELRVQFPIIEEMLASMNIPVVKVEGWEGDDVLGTIADKCEKLGFETLLVTGDKDANQLATDLTKIVNMKKGVSEVAILGPAEVKEKYGVSVEQFIDYLALMGDSSDNIPGVPGIGPKSASGLLQKYESLEGIYDHIDELKGKQQENIRENKDAAYVSRTAATISKEVPIDIDLENIAFPNFDQDTVSETFLKYRMRSALTSVLKLIGLEPEEESDEATVKTQVPSAPKKEEPKIQLQEIKLTFENYVSGDKAQDLSKKIMKGAFAIAVSHKQEEAVQTSLFDSPDAEKYPKYKNLLLGISNNKETAILEGDAAVEALVGISKLGCEVVTENAKAIYEILFDEFINAEQLQKLNFYDVSLAAYLLNSSKSEYSAVDAWQQAFGNLLPTLDANLDEGEKKTDESFIEKKNNNLKLRLARRAAASFALPAYLDKLLEENNADKIYRDIELPLTKVLVEMQVVGTKIDRSKLEKLSVKTAKLLDHLKSEIIESAGEEFNIDSPKQLSHILFEVLGLPAKKKTKTGFSTDAEVLADLSTIHELPGKIIEYREYAKLKSTYIDALPALADDKDIVHTTYNQKVTTTGRLSSSDPNIQNIPTRSEFGNQIRECFLPLQKDEVFLTADYSQIELRVLAHLSQDKGLIEAFTSGNDFHAHTAANVFGVSVDKVSPEMRRKAKAVNFGIVYGQQAYGLSQSLKIEMGEAKQMIENYFSSFPQVRKYLDKVVEEATVKGYAETMFGRRRYIPELTASNKRFRGFGERTAMNHPMQGSAADIIKIAMLRVSASMHEKNLKSSLMLQVHDELDLSVDKSEIDIVAELVKKEMENAVKLDVPLVVDIATGEN